MNYKGYKDLECYKKARELSMFISTTVKKFPAHEKFLLTSQIISCPGPASRNVAEGYGRYTFTDTRNFFTISRGYLTEALEQLMTAFDQHYITAAAPKAGEDKCEQVYKLINGYIACLHKVKKQGVQHVNQATHS